ncbi:MAG: NYN domain-containing protein [Phycisphaerales bacterium]|nr:NYN domain-containing protein [Phycisphaerales bacterium]
MPLVVDGNNLLYAANAVSSSSLQIGRSMLCDRLGMWAERRDERVHVVFDGPQPKAALARQIGHPAIQVTFSGPGVSADAVLEKLLQNDSAARRVVVVSSDRAVAQAAKRRGARPMAADVFWRTLERELARPLRQRLEPAEKEAGLDPGSVAEWLAEFGFERPAPEEPGGE